MDLYLKVLLLVHLITISLIFVNCCFSTIFTGIIMGNFFLWNLLECILLIATIILLGYLLQQIFFCNFLNSFLHCLNKFHPFFLFSLFSKLRNFMGFLKIFLKLSCGFARNTPLIWSLGALSILFFFSSQKELPNGSETNQRSLFLCCWSNGILWIPLHSNFLKILKILKLIL